VFYFLFPQKESNKLSAAPASIIVSVLGGPVVAEPDDADFKC
jgi:hypothetical protein